jgi:hypothetical protein
MIVIPLTLASLTPADLVKLEMLDDGNNELHRWHPPFWPTLPNLQVGVSGIVMWHFGRIDKRAN